MSAAIAHVSNNETWGHPAGAVIVQTLRDNQTKLSGNCVVQLRLYAMLAALLVAGASAGCTSRRSVSLERDSFVGEYIYHTEDKGSPHDPDKLTLREDGKYILVQMAGGKPGSQHQGVWHFESGVNPEILLGTDSYPIEIKGKNIRLLIDEDLGWSYEKTK